MPVTRAKNPLLLLCLRTVIVLVCAGRQLQTPVAEGFLTTVGTRSGSLPSPSSLRAGVDATLPGSAEHENEQIEDYESTVITVEDGEEGQRLDSFLVQRIPEQSRSYFGGLCQAGLVKVDGKGCKKSSKVEKGQEIYVRFAVSPELSIEPEDIPLDILFEDDELIAVNKPAGMVVHPAPGSWNGTFVNALVHHLQQSGGTGEAGEGVGGVEGARGDGEWNAHLRPGIVHRLDKGTTGVLLAAKNPTMQAKLGNLFAAREVHKTYLAVCVGNPGQGAVIDVPIGRHPIHRQKMLAVPTLHPNVRARRALSTVDTAAFDGKLGVAKVAIETGRTHQIRVHLQHRRTPVLGDEIYGNRDWNRRLLQSTGVTRPLLHAYALNFTHPGTGEVISLCASLPEDMAKIVARIYPQVHEEHPEWMGTPKPVPLPTKERVPIPGDVPDVPESLRDYVL
ncbi:unnamed protein product [Discosporangium mesarthrocarpum]